MPVCPFCGHEISEPDARFCPSCGRSLSAEGAAETTSTMRLGREAPEPDEPEVEAEAEAPERVQPGSTMLVVKGGPSSGARFLLDSDVTTVGRHPDSDIFLDDITVSRHHAEFARDSAGFRVRDVGSLNGTYVNRSRVDDVVLAEGDEVQIGKYRLVFVTGQAQP